MVLADAGETGDTDVARDASGDEGEEGGKTS